MPRANTGNYSLPNNPVIAGTVIDSDDENQTRTDIATELTNSLDRLGRGYMQAPLMLDAGSSTAPGLAFKVDPYLGWYRPSDHIMAATYNNTMLLSPKAGEVEVPGTQNFKAYTFAFSGGGTVGGNLAVTGTASTGPLTASSVASTGAVSGSSLSSTGSGTSSTFEATGGGRGLKLDPGTADCCYVEFYARSATPGTRTAYVGYPVAAATELNILNDVGHVRLTPTAGSAVKTAAGAIVLDTTASAALDATATNGFSILGPGGGNIAISLSGAITLNAGFGQPISVNTPLRTISGAFTTGTNFTPTGTPTAWRGATGIVTLFACYTAGSVNKQITTLPTGYTPATSMVVNLVAQATGGITSAQATISTAGVVTLVNAPASGDKFYLDGLTFMGP